MSEAEKMDSSRAKIKSPQKLLERNEQVSYKESKVRLVSDLSLSILI